MQTGRAWCAPVRRYDMTYAAEKLISLVLAFGVSAASFSAYII